MKYLLLPLQIFTIAVTTIVLLNSCYESEAEYQSSSISWTRCGCRLYLWVDKEERDFQLQTNCDFLLNDCGIELVCTLSTRFLHLLVWCTTMATSFLLTFFKWLHVSLTYCLTVAAVTIFFLLATAFYMVQGLSKCNLCSLLSCGFVGVVIGDCGKTLDTGLFLHTHPTLTYPTLHQ